MMESSTEFFINSIPRNNCEKTKAKVLDQIENCVICKEIPTPCYRSSKNQAEIYCKNCYDQQNFGNNYVTILPFKHDIHVLEKLIINCKNQEKGCQKTFTLKSAKEWLDHQSKCEYSEKNISELKNFIFKDHKIVIEKKNKKFFCERCEMYDVNNSHDCFKMLKNYLINFVKVENEKLRNELSTKSLISEEIERKKSDSPKDFKILSPSSKNENTKGEFNILSPIKERNEIRENHSPIKNTKTEIFEYPQIYPTFQNFPTHTRNPEGNFTEKQIPLSQTLCTKTSMANNYGLPSFRSLQLDYSHKNMSDMDLAFSLNAYTNQTSLFSINLKLNNNCLTETSAATLSNLVTNNKSLTNLALDLSSNNIEQTGINSLCLAIKSLSDIRYLKLNTSHNNLKDNGMLCLASCIGSPKVVKEIQLDLSFNGITDVGVCGLAENLSGKNQISEIFVNLRNNKISDFAEKELVEKLKKNEKMKYKFEIKDNHIYEN